MRWIQEKIKKNARPSWNYVLWLQFFISSSSLSYRSSRVAQVYYSLRTVSGIVTYHSLTVNIYDNSIEIPMTNPALLTTTNSPKVSTSDCDNDRQPDMASLAPKQQHFHFQLLIVAAIAHGAYTIQHWNFNGTSGLNDQKNSKKVSASIATTIDNRK